MHPQRNMQHEINRKRTRARFGRLLQPPAWKQNGSILEGVDNSGSKPVRK